jgi:uncharacterized membrane protein YhaH (DUF805 family)
MINVSTAGWYYARENAAQGPHSGAEMRTLCQAGAIASETLVWSEGMPAWAPARDTALSGFLEAASMLAPTRDGPTKGEDQPYREEREGALIEAVKTCVWRNFAVFSGRSDRTEYWYFAIFYMIVSLVIFSAVSPLSQGVMLMELHGEMSASDADVVTLILSAPSTLWTLAMLPPTLAATSRRLHDVGRSGWWQLIMCVPVAGWVVLLIWLLGRSAPGRNRFD